MAPGRRGRISSLRQANVGPQILTERIRGTRRFPLTMGGEKASNIVVVQYSPSREENLLSDHVFHFFGRTVTITGREEFLAIMVLVVVATAWAVQQFRRRRAVVLQRSVVSDQIVYELSRIADALDRLASRPIDHTIPAASGFKEEE